jgi:electron transfer flavoprotein beta subunit
MGELSIIVTAKQVPDTSEVRIDQKTGTLLREGVPSILNPDDRNAAEAALQLRDTHGGTVTAVTMGPPQADSILQELLAMGADRAVLLTDRAFAGSDTLITAFTLSRAIMKLGIPDLILCGRQAIDGDTAQVGPQLAGFLDLPQITCAEDIAFDGNRFTITRAQDEHSELLQVDPPALITVTGGVNQPRYCSLYHIERACSGSAISVWDSNELQIPETMLGLRASPTGVKKIFAPEARAKGERLSGPPSHVASTLIERLKDMNLLQ